MLNLLEKMLSFDLLGTSYERSNVLRIIFVKQTQFDIFWKKIHKASIKNLLSRSTFPCYIQYTKLHTYTILHTIYNTVYNTLLHFYYIEFFS